MAIEASSKARRWLASGLLLGRLMSFSGPARADDAVDGARAHYGRGYQLANEGDFEAAITEFERAYALSPNYSVLFNLGQAFGATGRAVKAAQTLERYLELGGANIEPQQRRRVAELVKVYRRRIGKLGLEVHPPGAEITLDGQRLGNAPLAGEAELEAGAHGLVVIADGFVTFARSVTVSPGETTHVAVTLIPRTGPAWLEIDCSIPNVRVSIDGVTHGQTPLTRSLLLQAGRRRLELSRAGYRTSLVELELASDEPTRYRCALELDPAAAASRLAVLHPQATKVTVDGAPFEGGPVAPGKHQVAVSGAGFESRELRVELAAGQSLRLRVVPPRSRSELERSRGRRAQAQRLVAYAAGGAAVVSGAIALALVVSNAGRYEDWRQKNRDFVEAHAGQSSPAAAQALDRLLAEENSIRNRDAVALGLGVAAGALLTASTALWLTAGAPEPTLIVTGSSAQLGYRSAF
ncbi:MAG: PEGA domain-containing protein [Myxococcales bacterium]|nr:MAG: PEGA domain-containing protein [Myxococcales bacterium]